MLSQHARDTIDAALKKYPPEHKRSAVLTALHEAQHDNHGHLTTGSMDAVAEHLGLPDIQVYEVASFYSMFETSPCGRHSVSVCKNISCLRMKRPSLVDWPSATPYFFSMWVRMSRPPACAAAAAPVSRPA